MFTLLRGPFHPHLEDALVETVQRIKSDDPRAPLTILVPSEILRRQVQWVLCHQHSCGLFDVHFFSFHQFALHLQAEKLARDFLGDSIPPPEIVGDLFCEYAVSLLLKGQVTPNSYLRYVQDSATIYQAIWETLRDIREAQIDPLLAQGALQEGMFEERATDRLSAVFTLEQVLGGWMKQMGVGLPDDLVTHILPWVPRSPFLKRQRSVLYYGFYDLTQIQLSLLEEVARASPVTIFFPIGKGSEYTFAQRFVDRYLLKSGVTSQMLDSTELRDARKNQKGWVPSVQVVNAVGAEGELAFVCKAIRHLVDNTGQSYHEIGIVARTLHPYLPIMSRMYKAHDIPFWTNGLRPITEEPMAKIWWQLAGLREQQYPWRSILDVVMAPWFQIPAILGASDIEQTDQWPRICRFFYIVRGREDWARLYGISEDSQVVEGWQQYCGLPLEEAKRILTDFSTVVDALVTDCQALPDSGSFGDLTQAFETLVSKFLPMERLGRSSEGIGLDEERVIGLRKAWTQVTGHLHGLDRLEQSVTWEEWVDEFRQGLDRIGISFEKQTLAGVSVLDVMAARGKAFSTLFILGLNDGVFPRVVREQAFLRDADRRVLAESLGYKIDEKMKGLEEETLLFTLLRTSAKRHLYLVYQRANESGRVLLPSPFLGGEPNRPFSSSRKDEWKIPLSVSERGSVPYFSPETEIPLEAWVRLLLQGRRPSPSFDESTPWAGILSNGLRALDQIEWKGKSPNLYDGVISHPSWHWQELENRGLSPTALNHYIQCPFRYWMEHVLDVQNHREVPSRTWPSRIIGKIVHSILENLYQDLIERKWFSPQQVPGDEDHIITHHVEKAFEMFAHRYGKGYELLWDGLRQGVTQSIRELIVEDRNDSKNTGFTPQWVEVEAEGTVPLGEHVEQGLLKIRGRFDRVDRSGSGSFRIVDYKTSTSLGRNKHSPDLLREALQGKNVQPPLYTRMGGMSGSGISRGIGEIPSQNMRVEFRYLGFGQHKSQSKSDFSGTVWETPVGQWLLRTIQQWISGIKEGQFFVLPGPYCQGCAWAVSCRSRHHPTWARTYAFPLAQIFRKLRKQHVKNGGILRP